MTTFSQKTAIIAASVLSVLTFFQLIVVFIVLVRRPGQAFSSVPAAAQVSTGDAAVAPLEKAPVAGKTPVNVVKPAPWAVENPDPAAVQADPATPPSEVDILIKRATDIREKGDMSGTLASLRDAQKLFPDDPKIIAEFAATYEQMGLVDKALTQWKRVMDAGDRAGDLYPVASEKVRLGITPRDPAGGRDEEGLQPGSTFGLVDIVKTYDGAGDSEQVNLRMGIKARKNATVNASQINIQAMFYDLIDNKEVEPTDPHATRVTSEWITPPPDWAEDGVEVLKVRYEQRPAVAGEKRAQDRKYLGYIIRVYYENELQDVTAEPVKLLQYFPPTVSLQKEIPQ